MPCLRRPGDAWWIVPPKYTPGTDALSQNGVCAGSLLRPTVAAPGVGLGRTRLGVMRRVLNAWYLRTPWLSHADGEDRDPAAILAVARFENPAITIATRPSPPASVAHLEPGPLGERSEISLHLRPRRVIRGAVHHQAHE